MTISHNLVMNVSVNFFGTRCISLIFR